MSSLTDMPFYEDDHVLSGVIDVVHEDRNVTIVEFEFGGRVARGVARRDPIDRYDRTTGVVLALSRSLDSMARKLQRESLGRNKHLEDVRLDQIKKAADKVAAKINGAEKKAVAVKKITVKKASAKKKAAKKAS